MLVVVVIAYLYILKDSNGIVCQCRKTEVLGQQIGGDTKLVETHQTGTERRGNLTRNTTLVQTNHTLVLLTSTDEDDLRCSHTTTCQELSFYLHLVRRYQGNPTPKNDFRSEEISSYWWYSTPCTLTLKGGNRTRMGYEESRLLPYQ